MSEIEFIGAYNIRTKYAPRVTILLKKMNEILDFETVDRLEDVDNLIEPLPVELLEEKSKLEQLYDENCSNYATVVRSSDGMFLCESPYSFDKKGIDERPSNKIVHICGLTLEFSFYHDGSPSYVNLY